MADKMDKSTNFWKTRVNRY